MGGASPLPLLTSGPYYVKKWPLIEPVTSHTHSKMATNLRLRIVVIPGLLLVHVHT
jgi:hypothetical protein